MHNADNLVHTNIFYEEHAERLRTRAYEVDSAEIQSRQTQKLVEDIIQRYKQLGHFKGGCPHNYMSGDLPSVSVTQKWINGKFDDDADPWVLFNPRRIKDPNAEYILNEGEGCGSIRVHPLEGPDDFTSLDTPNMRPTTLTVEALDQNGEPIRITVKGEEAFIMDHEIDHLERRIASDGVIEVFLDQLRTFENSGHTSEFPHAKILYRGEDSAFHLNLAAFYVRDQFEKNPKTNLILPSGPDGILIGNHTIHQNKPGSFRFYEEYGVMTDDGLVPIIPDPRLLSIHKGIRDIPDYL